MKDEFQEKLGPCINTWTPWTLTWWNKKPHSLAWPDAGYARFLFQIIVAMLDTGLWLVERAGIGSVLLRACCFLFCWSFVFTGWGSVWYFKRLGDFATLNFNCAGKGYTHNLCSYLHNWIANDLFIYVVERESSLREVLTTNQKGGEEANKRILLTQHHGSRLAGRRADPWLRVASTCKSEHNELCRLQSYAGRDDRRGQHRAGPWSWSCAQGRERWMRLCWIWSSRCWKS